MIQSESQIGSDQLKSYAFDHFATPAVDKNESMCLIYKFNLAVDIPVSSDMT